MIKARPIKKGTPPQLKVSEIFKALYLGLGLTYGLELQNLHSGIFALGIILVGFGQIWLGKGNICSLSRALDTEF